MFSYSYKKEISFQRKFNRIKPITIFISVLICASFQSSVDAQTNPSQSSMKNIEKEYKSCPGGYYSGPRPGRVRYTKDAWLWVVTPVFAKKFCMPTEFVSEALKGAEAIAFKIDDAPEEICGWGDKVEVCGKGKKLRFEVYINSSVKLPKLKDIGYFHVPSLPSKYLISATNKEANVASQTHKKNPREGTSSIFMYGQVNLVETANDAFARTLTELETDEFFQDMFDGIDYIAFLGTTGVLDNSMQKGSNSNKFSIAFKPLNDPVNKKMKLNEFVHVIEIPSSFIDQVRDIDHIEKVKLEEMRKRALGFTDKK